MVETIIPVEETARAATTNANFGLNIVTVEDIGNNLCGINYIYNNNIQNNMQIVQPDIVPEEDEAGDKRQVPNVDNGDSASNYDAKQPRGH